MIDRRELLKMGKTPRTTSVAVLFVFALAGVHTTDKPWHFAVSGDSRNCGDIVMPAVAKSALEHGVEFYWHLGDFRVGYDVDEDMRSVYGNSLTVAAYQRNAWGDFLTNQTSPFGDLPVYLGIGNHELYKDGQGREEQSHADFVSFFSSWLDTAELRKQRLADDSSADSPLAYYHWKKHSVDFINLDNSRDSGFEKEQVAWLSELLKKDGADQDVLSVVVGMHRAFPNSLACGHSMNGDPATSPAINQMSLESGRAAYRLLLGFSNTTRKSVYVLASHSHFFMDNIFDTPYWKNTKEQHRGVLTGFLIGTAGARRYRLPDGLPSDISAVSYTYGYLLGTAYADGKIAFEFQGLNEESIPQNVIAKYGKTVVDFCFLANRDDTVHTPEKSCNDQ